MRIGEVEILVGRDPVEVTFEIDANDVLRVQGVRLDGYQQGLTIEYIETHLAAAKLHAAADHAQRRALLDELGLDEHDFLNAATTYRSGQAIVTPPAGTD